MGSSTAPRETACAATIAANSAAPSNRLASAGAFDHVQRRPVFHATGVEAFQLGPEAAPVLGEGFLDAQHRGAAHQLTTQPSTGQRGFGGEGTGEWITGGEAVGDSHTGILCVVEQDAAGQKSDHQCERELCRNVPPGDTATLPTEPQG